MSNQVNDAEENINIILRQTTLTRDEAIEKLNIFNNDYMKVIKDFMGIDDTKREKQLTINQQIYKEIRTVLNEASANFRNNNKE